jgi:hypothetical protein
VNQYLRYPPVTNEDRTAMNIPNKDTIPTPVPPPEAQAEADITFPGVYLEKYKFRLSGEPGTGSDLPYSVFTRRKKERFDCDGESCSKCVAF